jgi:hypothetical protein
MNRLYTEAVNNIVQKLSEDIGRIKELSTNLPEWTKPHPITEPSPKIKGVSVSNGLGVYRIIYKPTMEVMSIGCGRIGARKARHKSVHQNKGKTLISENGSPSPSMTGMHMYRHDSNIDNWLFQWCHLGNKSLAESYEILLQEAEEPLFNDLSMGGL